ncbi:MAG: heat-inducible transcription repressor HrcA [Chloroflexi bacterium 13_1_40CM_4_68_4]|nr:MAG: heat-inducible transcription repressor HrcA [Chloroflexi bacterium 13_1_40CM_4_68_4]
MPKTPTNLQKSLPTLAERQRELLRAVIREYIATAEPVASAALVRRYGLGVSSATVRSELAALEELGLLTHPHTSAGRIPTDLGYRYFIESLMPRPGLLPAEQVTVSHQFQQAVSNTSEWLRLAASTLARLTTEASIVTPPATTRSALKHVEAVPISERRVLLVAVLEGGAVRQQLVELRDGVSTDHLRRLSSRLTATLGGHNATSTRASVATEDPADQELVRALAHMLEEQDATRAHDVYYDGIQNIMAQPEFTETDSIRDVVRLLEDRTRLSTILPQALGADEVHVAIGSEHRLEPLRGFSLVFGRYGAGTDVAGFVGVVGPTRMDYARSIGAVRYVGSLMSDLVRVMEGD